MASSESRCAVTLDFLVSLLDPARLRWTIDAPIDAVTQAFLARKPRARTTPEFNRVIIRFVGQIHARGLSFARIVSSAEAYGTAVRMLSRVYDPAGNQGYELALLAVIREKQEPIESVLRAIAEGIKETERDKYRSWIYGRYVEGLSWREKCALAAEVIRVHGRDSGTTPFPPDPACLAARLTDLIDAHIAALAAVQDARGRAGDRDMALLKPAVDRCRFLG